jgi:hypothetical protein
MTAQRFKKTFVAKIKSRHNKREIHAALQLISKLRDKHLLLKNSRCYVQVYSNEHPDLREEMDTFESEVADYLMWRSDAHFPYDPNTGGYKVNLRAIKRECKRFTAWFDGFAGKIKDCYAEVSVQSSLIDTYTKDVSTQPAMVLEIPRVEVTTTTHESDRKTKAPAAATKIIEDLLVTGISELDIGKLSIGVGGVGLETTKLVEFAKV